MSFTFLTRHQQKWYVCFEGREGYPAIFNDAEIDSFLRTSTPHYFLPIAKARAGQTTSEAPWFNRQKGRDLYGPPILSNWITLAAGKGDADACQPFPKAYGSRNVRGPWEEVSVSKAGPGLLHTEFEAAALFGARGLWGYTLAEDVCCQRENGNQFAGKVFPGCAALAGAWIIWDGDGAEIYPDDLRMAARIQHIDGSCYNKDEAVGNVLRNPNDVLTSFRRWDPSLGVDTVPLIISLGGTLLPGKDDHRLKPGDVVEAALGKSITDVDGRLSSDLVIRYQVAA